MAARGLKVADSISTPNATSKATALSTAASKYAIPTTTPTTTINTTATTQTAPTTPKTAWVPIVKRPAPKKLTERKLKATVRAFSQYDPTAPQGYSYVYIPRARKINRSEIRHRLSTIGIDTGRIVDITLPAHRVIGLLVHNDFTTDLSNHLKACKVVPLEHFDPLDEKHIANPAMTNASATDRTRFAKALQQDRCIRALRYVRAYLVPSVARFFVDQGWIADSIAKEIVAERNPRPLKRTRDIGSSSTTAAAFLTSLGFVTGDSEMIEADKLVVIGCSPLIGGTTNTTNNHLTLSIGLWNANGLQQTTVADVLSHCSSMSLLLVTESWILSPSRLPTSWHQFHTYGKPVQGGYRGSQGIVALVNPNCPVPVSHLSSPSPYALSLNFGPFRLACFYFPPNLPLDEVIATLDKVPLHKNTILCGDFNARFGRITGDT
ncbi:hypothetical protein BDF20DRAFT_815769, partial [Mycotypha africana]|uniref:uncharacterized protein n=1 Tax=Mycotypha africana TaxID=64632 RepID=UPI00230091B3